MASESVSRSESPTLTPSRTQAHLGRVQGSNSQLEYQDPDLTPKKWTFPKSR